MDRIPVCGKCLKTGCYVGLSHCDNDDGMPNFVLLKTEAEIREIGKEKIICRFMYLDSAPADWLKISPIKYTERFDMCFKKLE